MRRIVIEDKAQELCLGELVDGENSITRAVNRGVVLLPVDEDFIQCGVEQFAFASWGRGWLFDASAGHRGCGMTLRVDPERPCIYWAARIDIVKPGAAGSLKLTGDTSRGDNALTMGLEQPAPRIEQLGLPVGSSAVIGGRLRISSCAPGFASLSVYGVASGVMVRWSAVSQATKQVDLVTCFRATW